MIPSLMHHARGAASPFVAPALAFFAIATFSTSARAATINWKGLDWNVTTGGMAGVVLGDPKNVTVDASGYLHLKISKTGGTWTAAELYSATSFGFGTYQWQVSGPIDRMDHNVVLGLSPYGPAAGVGADGFNEIDTEFSYWNDEIGNVNMDWGVYPATAAAKHWETDFLISLSGGTETTTRMTWSSTSVVGTVMSGYQAMGSTAGQLETYTYAPPNFQDAIPQQPLPVLLNLWCYKAAPADGNDVEVVLQDFQFVPEGQPIPDAGAPDDAGSGAGDGGAVQDAGGGGTKDAGGPPSEDASAPPGSGGGHDAAAPSGGTGGTGGGGDASTNNGSGGGVSDSGGCDASGARNVGPRGAMGVLLALVALLAIGRRRAPTTPASSCQAIGVPI